MGTPSDGFNRCLVLCELRQRLYGVRGPEIQLVIVASRGQLGIIEAPL